MDYLHHYIIPRPADLTNPYTVQKISAAVADMTDQAICNAIIQSAKESSVTDLYLMDKTFILDAIREKLDREKPKPLTLEELMNAPDPVWIQDNRGVGTWANVAGHTSAWVYFTVFSGADRSRTATYGTDWLAYRHRPKEA